MYVMYFSAQLAPEVPGGRYFKPPTRGDGKRWRPGTQALREIRLYQRTVKLCISKAAFMWYVQYSTLVKCNSKCTVN